MNIQFVNGSEIIMCGLDEETKLLSLADISTVFIEEVFEVEESKFQQLDLRMRGKAKSQQIIAAFNPISKNHWLYTFCVEKPPVNLLFSETTYKDNPFLSKEYIAAIESYKDRNPWRWNIYGLGNWGNDPSGLVFTNWRQESFSAPELAARGLKRRSGMDIGWTDPSAIVNTLYDKDNKTIYVYQEFYATGKTLDELASAMEKMELKHQKCFVDAADPRAIDFFRRKGFNTQPCIKGAGSVEMGISFLQNLDIVVHPSCKNVINELENFAYLKDKKTDKYTEKMDHTYSHSIDAIRYAYSDLYTNKQLKTFDIKLLNI